MDNPFATKAIVNFVKQQIKSGVPETRIPTLCKNKFTAFNLSLWHWEQYTKEFIDILKTEVRYSDDEARDKRFAMTDASDADSVLALIRKGYNLFVTGKAGTGKTTILRKIVEQLNSRGDIVVLAPTGVAAKNAQGATIHSFFQMDIGPWIPNKSKTDIYKLTPRAIETIRNTSLIIIDEVSMVRCDILDKMSYILKFVKNSSLPFGGTQIVFFGDLYQLIPVAEDEDLDILNNAYKNIFFFNSSEFRKLKVHVVELTKVYRQDNPKFVHLLNSIRVGQASYLILSELNTRFSSVYKDKYPAHGIRLTTHNYRANNFNREQMKLLRGAENDYVAKTSGGYIDKADWPTDWHLRLKVGARVMFLRNDNEDGQYVNGTLGAVKEMWDDGVRVLTDDGNLVNVFAVPWDFYRYTLDKTTRVVYREKYASFIQLPLRLAWCVTIHKSQGLTFNQVVIDASKAFAAGQVYVALSRCRTLEGVYLTDRILPSNIMIDKDVKSFLSEIGIKDTFAPPPPSENTLADQIIELLRSNPGIKATIIAQALKVGKSEINSLLYGELTARGLVSHDTVLNKWSLKE